MERFGIVGLPNAGKSSLFNALTGGRATVAPHPFSTTETNVGVAKVPDDRLTRLAAMSESRKVVPAVAEFVDIAGLQKGSAQGEGLGNRFLHGIREADAVCYVLRAFEDENVVGGTAPLDDLATLELELTLADATSAEGQLERRRKAGRFNKSDKEAAAQLEALEQAMVLLQDATPLYRAGLAAETIANLQPFFLITAKPVLAVVNLGEDQVVDADSVVAPVSAELGGTAEVLGVSVQLEAEAAQLDPGERSELLEGLGLGEGALPRVIHRAYHLLGLRTFLTTGDKESRAWTFRAGAKAPECAGVIHSDLQRGFIRAEVIRWDELLALGSWARAKELGKLRVEGKDYEAKDGDVLEIRFNV
ncbi:MAG: redox-regulated ATPase YchF [Acidimicrobiia bacterium]|nr:redox-regulated ATPase YchF [Acidimicrobiia bacterium]